MAADLGFAASIVADATATFARLYRGEWFNAETIHQAALASLGGEFASVVTTQQLCADIGRRIP